MPYDKQSFLAGLAAGRMAWMPPHINQDLWSTDNTTNTTPDTDMVNNEQVDSEQTEE